MLRNDRKLSYLTFITVMDGEGQTIVLVTGGTGLVGKGIETIVNSDKQENETWYFASSKDADLS